MKVILKEDDEAYNFFKAEMREVVKSAFAELLDEFLKEKNTEHPAEEWCDSKRAMEILGVRKTKMQEIRDHAPHNGIRISKDGRTMRYHVPSLYEYLKKRLIQ